MKYVLITLLFIVGCSTSPVSTNNECCEKWVDIYEETGKFSQLKYDDGGYIIEWDDFTAWTGIIQVHQESDDTNKVNPWIDASEEYLVYWYYDQNKVKVKDQSRVLGNSKYYYKLSLFNK